jgi:GDPmannose 4,6-dehydratase
LGNINPVKDWEYAKDYIQRMWKILNYDKPDDFVLGTGEAHTVREFVEEAFKVAGINIQWEGSVLNEKGISDDGRILVKVNKEFFRPLDTNPFIADYSKAKKLLNWYPKTSFKNLVKIMVKYDIEHYRKT